MRPAIWILLPLIIASSIACHWKKSAPVNELPGRTVKGIFIRVGPMQQARPGVDGILLQDGCALLVDAISFRSFNPHPSLGTAELFDPRSRAFYALPKLQTSRIEMALALLPDGSVLLAGGYDTKTEEPTNLLDLYHADTGTFSTLPFTLVRARSNASSVTLKDGRVLILGGKGKGGGAIPETEIFDPAKGTCTVLCQMLQGREEGFTATLLNDGRVLVAGGVGPKGHGMADAEIFDPAKMAFKPLPAMGVGRTEHMAVLLKDGSVLLTGGEREVGSQYVSERSAEVFDPKHSRFVSTGTLMATDRTKGKVALLTDGRALILGGFVGRYESGLTEIYDPNSKTFLPGPKLNFRRSLCTALPLKDGSVLVAGDGIEVAELLE